MAQSNTKARKVSLRIRDGSWLVDYRDNQGRRRRRVVAKKGDKRTAVRAQAQIQAELAESAARLDARPDVSMRDAFENWLRHAEGKGRKTIKNDVQKWPHIQAALGGPDRLISTIRPADLEALKDRLAKRVSPARCNRYLALIRAVLRLAEKQDLILKAPFVALYKEPPARKDRWTNEQFEVVLSLGDETDCLLLVLARDCGLRLHEAINLLWSDICHTSTPPYLMVRDGKTGSRNVPLTKRALLHLDVLRSISLGPESNVFRKYGKPWTVNAASNRMAKLRKAAGLDHLWFHDLRRTRGTEISNRGANAFTVARYMGHRSIKTSLGYMHPDVSELAAAIGMKDDE